jgi:hypothetical protein
MGHSHDRNMAYKRARFTLWNLYHMLEVFYIMSLNTTSIAEDDEFVKKYWRYK